MKKSNLVELHKKLGGNFSADNQNSTPDFYEGEELEVIQTRNFAGITDISERGILKISGKDHLKLLQGMLTNDVVKLETGKGRHAAALTVKGRMIADIRLFKFADYIIIDTEPGQNTSLAEHLNKFKLSYRAEVSDCTNDFLHFHICGPDSSKILNTFLNIDLNNLGEYEFREGSYKGSELILIKINRTGETGYDILISPSDGESLFSKLISDNISSGLKPFGKNALSTLRIEAGIPFFGIDMDENTIPIEAGIWDALDFEKGCYIGQEVIARIKWRGRVNWHLVGFQTEGRNEIPLGSKISNESKEIGRVTSSAFSPSLGNTISLGYIRRELKEEGNKVLINAGENSQLNAVVCVLPFINNFN